MEMEMETVNESNTDFDNEDSIEQSSQYYQDSDEDPEPKIK